MHTRYKDQTIRGIWLSTSIYEAWQEVELTVIDVREEIGTLPQGVEAVDFRGPLSHAPIDEIWIDEREKVTNHDLIAFVEERRRHLPPAIQHLLHDELTSYCTEEPARAMLLQKSATYLLILIDDLLGVLKPLAKAHPYSPMLAETHGQWAGIMSFSIRPLKWYFSLKKTRDELKRAIQETAFAKISGAFGTYSDVVTPELEQKALARLGLKPFYGATQIVPRTVWIPLSQAILNAVEVCGNMAETLRLGARSGYQITQEPFKKGQKGSSAMPHKRNPITWEKVVGMAAARARNYQRMLQDVCTTWAERDIRESNVERDAWPDLFHTAAHVFKCMKRSLEGLVVGKEAMLRQIRDSRGTFATDRIKGWLAEKLGALGVEKPADMAYSILQRASFEAFKPSVEVQEVLDRKIGSVEEVDEQFRDFCHAVKRSEEPTSIGVIIFGVTLGAEDTVDQYQDVRPYLKKIWAEPGTVGVWEEFFKISTYLRKEEFLYQQLLAEP